MTNAKWVWYYMRDRNGAPSQGWLDYYSRLSPAQRDEKARALAGVGQVDLLGQRAQAQGFWWCEYIDATGGFGPWNRLPMRETGDAGAPGEVSTDPGPMILCLGALAAAGWLLLRPDRPYRGNVRRVLG